ncbi:hypothetical protein ACFFMM_24755 [Micromonospora chaiyaphumensis]|uniref:Uncharacterized protein n=1 Tax=Micromonospora chaiyaphumensis TaxID=307119 RepID=A0A1C4UN70_9ACTN|nr:hypothetical protein [Micromonospora chaiyaphumensis]SCE73080.1 hypothetical protein GA0070214_101855 [Micromonospora chaiyaphumensis]
MPTPRTVSLRRRGLLGIPALVTAALAVTTRPAAASAAPSAAPAAPKAECLADLLGES